MRKLIFFAILSLVFASCSNVAKYKDAIETLSTNWESAQAQVVAMVDQISQAQEQGKSALESMTPSEDILAQLSEEQQSKLGELKQQVQTQVGDLGGLSQTAFEFVNKWQEESAKLTDLKDGLSSGKLPSDVQSTIDSLTGMVSQAEENVSTWGEQVNEAKGSISSATQSYNEMIAAVSEMAE